MELHKSQTVLILPVVRLTSSPVKPVDGCVPVRPDPLAVVMVGIVISICLSCQPELVEQEQFLRKKQSSSCRTRTRLIWSLSSRADTIFSNLTWTFIRRLQLTQKMKSLKLRSKPMIFQNLKLSKLLLLLRSSTMRGEKRLKSMMKAKKKSIIPNMTMKTRTMKKMIMKINEMKKKTKMTWKMRKKKHRKKKPKKNPNTMPQLKL